MAFEIVKLRYLVIRPVGLSDHDRGRFDRVMSDVKKMSRYKVEHIYVNVQTAERLGITAPGKVMKDKYSVGIIVQCVFKNPNVLKRIYAPLLSCNLNNFYSKLIGDWEIPDLYSTTEVTTSKITRLQPAWMNNAFVDLVIKTSNII